MSDILRGDRVVIGVGPKVWLVESAGRIGRRPPHARLRDQDWQRITMPQDTLTRVETGSNPWEAVSDGA